MRFRLGLFATLVAVMGLLGCGQEVDKGVKVQAQVVQGGKPIKFLKDEEIIISFAPPGGDATATGGTGTIKQDETTATITTPKGKGLIPGKYKVSLSSQIYGGDGKDRFEGGFDAARSPLTADVGSEPGQTFVIDIGKRSVQKQ